MATNPSKLYLDPAGRVPAIAGSGGVTGCQFAVLGAGTVGNRATVVKGAVNGVAYGVAMEDKAAGEAVLIWRRGVVAVKAGVNLAINDPIYVGALGVATNVAGTGPIVGYAHAVIASGAIGPILLSL